MNKEKLQKFNKPWLGLLLGLILPMVSFLIYFLVKPTVLTLGEFIEVMKGGNAFIPILSLCVLPNLLLYFVSKQLNLWYTIKGIVFSVFIYTLVVLVLKFT